MPGPRTLSEVTRRRIASLWNRMPLRADKFARAFVKRYPHPPLTLKSIEKALKRSKLYIDLSESPKQRWRGAERHAHLAKYRGYMVFADFVYLLKKRLHGARFCLVVVDSFSKLTFFQPSRALTSKAAAGAMQKIMSRIPFAITTLMTDRGSEVGSRALVSIDFREG